MEVIEGLDIAKGVTDMGISIGSKIAKLIPTQRKCAIELTNESSKYTLCNPSVYIKSGRCSVPLTPSIKPAEGTGEALFVKIPNTAGGSVGIFTYDLLDISTTNSSKKMPVLFKVPFNRKQTPNMYAVGIFDISKECNQSLFNEMSKDTNATFVRGKAKDPGLTHISQNVTIMATMSDCYEPVLKVQMSDN